METPEIFSPSGDDDGSPHTGTFRSKSVLSRVANAELAAGTENGLNERYACGVCGVCGCAACAVCACRVVSR
jgi:hypothetical protein